VPFRVLVGEAVDVARFAQRNWEAALGPQGQTLRAGLSSATGGTQATPMDRAQFVLAEVRATLEWVILILAAHRRRPGYWSDRR